MGIISAPLEDWQSTAQRIRLSDGPIAWSWAAACDQQGRWQLTDFVVRAATNTQRRVLRYQNFVISIDRLSPRAAAERLLIGKVGAIRSQPEFHIEPPASKSSGAWWTTEVDNMYQTAPPEWPEFRIEWSVPGAGNTSISRPGDILSAPGQPFYPNVDAALAEHVYCTRSDQLHLGSMLTVRVIIPDRRLRIRDVQFEDELLRVGVDEGKPRGCRGMWLRSAWRTTWKDLRWTQFDAALNGASEVHVPTGFLPDEMWIILTSRTGQPLDRRGWDRLFGTRPHLSGPLVAQVEGWITEGEHQALEYKQQLGDDKTNRRFADTVAAFANGTGGVVLIGIADDGTIVGWDPPKPSDRISNILRDLLPEPVSVQIERVEPRGIPVTVVLVPPGDPLSKPYRSAGRIMVRVLGTTREATTMEIRRMMLDAQPADTWRGRSGL